MSKYELISDNVIISTVEEITSYFYSVPLVNTELTGHKTSEVMSESLTEIVRNVEKNVDIYILPTEVDMDEIIKHYDNNYLKNGIKDIASTYEKVRKDIHDQINLNPKYNYKLILVFSDTSKHYFKSNYKLLKYQGNNQVTLAMKKIAIENEEAIFESIKSVSTTARKLDANETTDVLKYLTVPEYEYSEYSYQESDDHIHYKYETKDEVKEKVSVISTVNKFPHEIEGYFDFISTIQKLRFPVDTIIKLTVHNNASKIEKNITTNANVVDKDAEKFRRENDKELQETKYKRHLGRKGREEFEDPNRIMLEMQLFFRITAPTKEAAHKRYTRLKSILLAAGKKKVEPIILLGNQAKASKHILPGMFTISKYNHHINQDFFTALKLTSGITIGDKTGIVVAYTTDNEKPLTIDFLAPMENDAIVTSTSILGTGVTGSGKTQMFNQVTLNLNIVYGIKSLTIDPKGDRSKIASRFDFVNEIKITDSKYKGALDPFLQDMPYDEKLNKVCTIIQRLLYINGNAVGYDNASVTEAFNIYMSTTEEKSKSFKGYLQELFKKNFPIARIVSSFEYNKYSSLYFSDGKETTYTLDYSNLNTIINLDAPASISSDDKIPKTEKTKTIDQKLLELVISECEYIVYDFMKKVIGPKLIVIDEVAVVRGVTSPNFIDGLVRQGRSFGAIIVLLTQNFTDLPSEILENIGMFFVGSVRSSKQIEEISSKFRINKKSLEFLDIDTVNPDAPDKHKHIFLVVDANLRKMKVKAKFLPVYKGVFKTSTDSQKRG